jgi:hypothetical protein
LFRTYAKINVAWNKEEITVFLYLVRLKYLTEALPGSRRTDKSIKNPNKLF